MITPEVKEEARRLLEGSSLELRNALRAELSSVDKCPARLHTGPGHMSTAYCEVVGGPPAHDKASDSFPEFRGATDGELIHRLGYQEWVGLEAYD